VPTPIINGFTGYAGESMNPPEKNDSEQETAKPFSREEVDEIDERDRRWAWVEIDRGAIRSNVIEAKHHMRSGCRLLAVVKADGYGHGAVECARIALNAGASYLGVATVDEGIQLRKADITEPILILSQPPQTSIPLLLAYNIMPSVYTTEFALAYGEIADHHGMKAPFHLAVNTGMNRIGVRYDDVVEFERVIGFHRALEQKGMFTHFATADCPDNIDFTIAVNRFNKALEALHQANIDPGIVHAANSAALFRYPKVHYDMCRLGIAMYGIQPCKETRGIADLKPAMSVYARITQTNQVPMSDGVSYGLNWRSSGSTNVCTIPLGYADGLRRGLSGKTKFILDGQYCDQIGNICMDQTMFAVDMRTLGNKPKLEPHIGDKVTIIGRQGDAVLTATEQAYEADTIEHEITCGYAARLPRYYV